MVFPFKVYDMIWYDMIRYDTISSQDRQKVFIS